MVSRRSGRYLESFLEPVAPLCLSMGPNGPTATRFTPKTIDFMPSIFSNIPQKSSLAHFHYSSISPSSLLQGVGTPPDFSGMSNYVDSLPPNLFMIQESQVFEFSVWKNEKTTQYGNLPNLGVCGAHILLFPQKSDFWDFYILNIYKKLTFENSVS